MRGKEPHSGREIVSLTGGPHANTHPLSPMHQMRPFAWRGQRRRCSRGWGWRRHLLPPHHRLRLFEALEKPASSRRASSPCPLHSSAVSTTAMTAAATHVTGSGLLVRRLLRRCACWCDMNPSVWCRHSGIGRARGHKGGRRRWRR